LHQLQLLGLQIGAAAVGIGGHSPETSDVMYTRPSVRSPSDRDRATLRNLLGRAADITL
jgi:predicted Zn-dependent protease